MSRVQQLYRLQSLDNEVAQVRQQLAEIAAELGESEALKQAKTAAVEAEKKQGQIQATMQDLDLEVKGLVDKITNNEKKLYSGKGLSPKEAGNLQQEITALKRWQSQREDLLLEVMVELEDAEERLNQAQSHLSTIQAAWATNQEKLSRSQSTLEIRIAELLEQRPFIVSRIDKDDLAIYEDLRSKKAGQAVAAVRDGVCQGCWMGASNSKIQQARAEVELMYCGTCGRILYVL